MGSFTTKVWDLDGLNMQEKRISLINYVWLVVGGYQGTWFIDIYQRVINTNPQFSRDTYQPTSFMDAIGALIMAVPWLPYSFSVASIRGSWRWFILWYESMIYDLHTRKKKHIIILLIILKESSDNFLEYSYNRWFYIFLILKKKADANHRLAVSSPDFINESTWRCTCHVHILMCHICKYTKLYI